ncbi:MAG: ankyrin repeat domain-containing protein, partial [Planctomycetes bacterium]|nr:ankyrin repeat domain-containing protein [Planctomycetota bacterium]
MSHAMTRRGFHAAASGLLIAVAGPVQADPAKVEPAAPTGPVESPFERDYAVPEFKPSWKKPQVNRTLVQDFVIYAHSDLEMTKKLLEKEPTLVNAVMDWGAGDWESGLGGASHMGRKDIVSLLLSRGARIDLFCAAMLGQLDVVKALLT